MPSVSRSKTHPLALRLRPPYWTGLDRPCEVAGCGTLLSGYNPGPRCLAHTVEATDERAEMMARSRELDLEAKRYAKVARELAAR